MIIALLLSGGTGTRLGSKIPKQYIKAGEREIITYSLETLLGHGEIDALQIVAEEQWRDAIKVRVEELDKGNKFRGFSLPGDTRQLSIYQGLKDIKNYADKDDGVLIHDAARPCLSPKQISDCICALEGHDGVLPVLPMKDTVYQSTDGGRSVSALLDRSTVFAGQAPELFRLAKYLQANERLMPEEILKINGSTEPAILAGMDIAMIPGDENNFKITSAADLARFEEGLRMRGNGGSNEF